MQAHEKLKGHLDPNTHLALKHYTEHTLVTLKTKGCDLYAFLVFLRWCFVGVVLEEHAAVFTASCVFSEVLFWFNTYTFVALCLIPLLPQTHLQNFHTGPEDMHVGGIAGIYDQNFVW